MSDAQEAAQFLAGEALPLTLLNGVIQKSALEGSDRTELAVLNLTPYDGWVERTCKKFPKVGYGSYSIRSMSLTKSLNLCQFVEKSLALELMEADQTNKELEHARSGKLGVRRR